MNLFRKLLVTIPAVIVLGATLISAAPALAATSCTTKVVGSTNDAGKSTSRVAFSNNNTVASVSVQLSGAADCQNTFTLVSWEAPNAHFDHANLDAQKLHSYKTQTFTGPGTYKVSVDMLDCYYQIDFLNGGKPTDANGKPFYNPGPMAWAQGGSKSCIQPPAPTYSCNALTLSQGDNRTVTVTKLDTSAANGATFKNAVINWGDSTSTTPLADATNQTHQYSADGARTITATATFTVNGKDVSTTGNCTQNVSFTTPTPTPTPTPTALPNTGAGNVIGMFVGISTIAGLAYHFLVARRRTA